MSSPRRIPEHVVIALAIAIAIASTGCKSKQQLARESFAKDHSCPLAEVLASEHTELSSYDLTFGKLEPPADIAADPTRVALWREENERKRKLVDASSTVFLGEGCNQQKYYACSRSDAKQGSNLRCSPLSALPPRAP